MKKKEIMIFGAGGHARSVADLATDLGYKIRCFVSPNIQDKFLFGVPVICENKLNFDCAIAIAIGDNNLRKSVYSNLSKESSLNQFPTLIHPSATISKYSKIAYGTIIFPHSVVGTNTIIKKFSILNIHSSLDHDSTMGNFTSLGPGAVTGGNVNISNLSRVEIGCVIAKGIKIEENCVIGANSFLNMNTVKSSVYYGSPAKLFKKN